MSLLLFCRSWARVPHGPKRTVATRTTEDLFLTAPVAQQACESMRGSADPVHDQEVYRETHEELERQWLRGPFSLEELRRRQGSERNRPRTQTPRETSGYTPLPVSSTPWSIESRPRPHAGIQHAAYS